MSTERQKKRIDSKKKKAKAFLDLIKTEKDVQEDEKTTSPQNEEAKETKRQKIDEIPTIDMTIDQLNHDVKHEEIDDVLLQKRKVLRERQQAAMKRPKIFLTLDELTRDSPYESTSGVKETPPLVMMDVQQLLLYGLLGNRAPCNILRWCRLLRVTKVSKVVAVILDSVSKEELTDYPESLPTLMQDFDVETDIIPPEQYGSSVREDLLNVQISVGELRRKILKSKDKETVREKFNSLKEKRTHSKNSENIQDTYDTVTCLDTSDFMKPSLSQQDNDQTMVESELSQQDNDQTILESEQRDCEGEMKNMQLDRRSLMLNTAQMLGEGIPMPFGPKVFNDYVFSKDKYDKVTCQSPMFGIDCEMVQSVESMMDLARVSVVNDKLECVYDSFVKPKARIKNYVTKFSGITRTIMESCNTSLEEARKCIQDILPSDAILCGQSISGDLKSLKMFHPYIIDTSVIYNLTGMRRMKTGLKRLSAHFLSQDIQNDPRGHSSVEDARATIELVLLKLQNGVDFGDLAWDMSSSIANTIASLKEDPQQITDNEEGNETVKRKCASESNPETTEAPSLKKPRLSRQIVTGKITDGETYRHKLFFLGSGELEFLLNRIHFYDKSGIVIEEPKSSQYYPDNSDVIYMDTDKQRYKETVKSVTDKDLVVTSLYSYRNHLETVSEGETLEERVAAKKKCLKKLDKNVFEIMSSLPDCSLFMVILSGRNTYGQPPAKVFCKITGPSQTV